ncbi:MAG: condensation domain-containing protein, partial [Lewinella sp.]|uniref:non-ribosomal peptide synthetase n=1 Tax=Lewinella sp. TaxID=2004506 RepID=UPI003D6A37F1
MNALELFTSLINLGVKLYVDDNKLKVKAPPGIITLELQHLIKENKKTLITFLQGFEIEVAPVKDYYATSSAQKRLYFLNQFNPESLAYNMPQFVKLHGEVDIEKMESVFKKLIDHHESFRTSFQIIDGQLVQIILEEVDFTLDYFEAEPTEAQPIVDDFIKAFDLMHPPLLRVGLIKTGQQEYILMVDMHHIISDGTSQGNLIKDFMVLYGGEELSRIRLQYKDFAEWQQGEDYQTGLANQRQFWLDQFSDEITVLELPYDFPRPKVKSFEGDRVEFSIGKEDTVQLRRITKQHGGTMFMTLLAIFNILLSKLGNQEDIIIGIPTAGRENADLQEIIGVFINTLALRNYPKGSLNFTEFLLEVQANTLGCLENQSYQYEDLIESLQIQRDTSRNPLFDILFSFENFEEIDLEMPGLRLEAYEEEQVIAKFDLTLTATELMDEILLTLNFSTEIFEKSSISKFVSYFKHIVREVCDDPTQKISEINILSEAEKNKLLFDFNDTVAAYPDKKSIIDIFEEQVSKTPQHIALVHNELELTYEELNNRANQLAGFLIDNGIEEGTVIGLMLARSMDMIVGILGILKASAIYLPLDKEQPKDRIEYILRDSNAKVLLTEEDYSFDGVKNFSMAEMQDSDTTSFTFRKTTSKAPAYIIYTSGSTGRPKGVIVKHQSVVNLIYSQKRLFNIDETERILQFSTHVFDASIEQILLALFSGAALVIIDKEVLTSNSMLARYLVDQQITHFDATPSYLEGIEFEGENSLRRIVSGGEECKASLVGKFVDRYDFYNAYGPTENTVTSLVKYFPKGSIIEDGPVPIGRPINNTFVYILGKHGELLPQGSIGE